MHFDQDPFYLSFHEDCEISPWRRLSPCLHPHQSHVCNFPTENDICEKYNQDDDTSHMALKHYKELEEMLMTKQPTVEQERKNEKLLNLPIERYLTQYKIQLKRELCKNKNCQHYSLPGDKEKCDKAHSIKELFTQFDQPFLKEFYSYHFTVHGGGEVKPVLPKKRGHILELSCHKCNSQYFQHSALLILNTIDGKLLEPRISRNCLMCGSSTHFLVYFFD